MTRALILGASGQLGRALQLIAPPASNITAHDVDKTDICDAAAVARTLRESRAEVVFNCAAFTRVDDAESQRAGVSVKLPGGLSERQSGDTSAVLNQLGAEGWELVSYHSSGAGTWGFEQFWLKRQSSS